MGQRSTETVKEIEQVRERLGDQIEELEQRLPAPAKLAKRGLGVLVGGGALGAVAWMSIRRWRDSRKTRVEKAQEAVAKVVPDRWSEAVRERFEDDDLRRWMLIGAGAWLVFRLVELRQLRKMNQALLAR